MISLIFSKKFQRNFKSLKQSFYIYEFKIREFVAFLSEKTHQQIAHNLLIN